jgi:DNA (cytosine-5)-methyltransferase 1
MAKQYCIRKVPAHIDRWVAAEKEEWGLSKEEFLRRVLQRAFERGFEKTLFDGAGRPVRVLPDALPFRFADLFAGIGGFRIALSKLGGECVFSCEYDKYARITYRAWFNESDEGVFGDINELRTDAEIDAVIPDHDILAAGFPCQPFSIAGVTKKKSLGRAHGFQCKEQGNLFFKIRDIVRVKRPPILFLENVKNLKSHDRGRTWNVIMSTLQEELRYKVYERIVDACHWVPQHRERIFIVCFDRREFGDDPDFAFPEPPAGEKPVLASVLEETADEKYVLTDHLWRYLQAYADRHRRKGNGFGYGLCGPQDRARTLSARYYKDGAEVLVRPPRGGHPNVSDPAKSRDNPRRLTPREAGLLMGFTDEYGAMFGHLGGFPQVVSDTQAYKQYGNAVVPAAVEFVSREIVRTMAAHLLQKGNGCLLKR